MFLEELKTTRLVRVLLVSPSGDPEPRIIEPRVENLEELVGASVMPLPVDANGRLVLYVGERDATPNDVASRTFHAFLRGPVVLAAFRAAGGLDDFSDGELDAWADRVRRA